jgi:RNA polymerase sigma factor, sigma-70 family
LNEDALYIKQYLENRSEQAAYNLVQKYRKFVYLTVLQKISDSDEAKDITQEVFIKVLNSLNKFDNRSSFKTWLYRIAVNESINVLRKKKLRQFFSINSNDDDDNEMQFKDDSPNPEQNYEASELYKQIMDAINKLPKKQREVFMLKYFDELTYEEMSQITGVSVGALKANYFYAIRKLAELLKHLI